MSDEKTTMTFRVEKSLRDAYDRAAKSNDRTGSQLLRDFMREYVRSHAHHAQGDLFATATTKPKPKRRREVSN